CQRFCSATAEAWQPIWFGPPAAIPPPCKASRASPLDLLIQLPAIHPHGNCGQIDASQGGEWAIASQLVDIWPDGTIRPLWPGRIHGGYAMRSDTDIKRDTEDELRWNPEIDSTDIGVAVSNGVVTLTGFARSYIDK